MMAQGKLQQLVNTLTLLDARGSTKDIMYARQHMFEHRDKPGTHLARRLVEVEVSRKSSVLNEAGQKMVHLQQKVEIFAQYFTKLYESPNPAIEGIDHFGGSTLPPRLEQRVMEDLNIPIMVHEKEETIV